MIVYLVLRHSDMVDAPIIVGDCAFSSREKAEAYLDVERDELDTEREEYTVLALEVDPARQ